MSETFSKPYRTARRLSPAARSSEPCWRLRSGCRHPPPRRPAAHLWLQADRRAPQARAAIRRTPARQRQAHLPPDEEARIAAAALYRPTPTRRARRQIITIRSNIRWCADALEFTCWNGEIVRIAFVLDCHDREVIAWLATTAGISGEMIRDMMIECGERRFGGSRAPHKVQWLTDNGSIFAAYKTMNIALALNLEPCFTPVESPESNGMAEAFVKTLKRDYVRVSPIGDAAAALTQIDRWMEDYNTVHPHSRLGYRSPREYINAKSQSAACPV